ncbi:hypothetical protein SAMN04487846_1175 [Microbacterium sp. cf046]|uniref:endonuclease domain-containing protein n=1 Tax=Microbacterium sp. cf046 TaxID=1761803 RepID=UPI0008EC365F|nr:hypothetical protein [Microbacterium sp. cf046]SFR95452.1 hypothetical protein SAMN04487846_1175 [Microbacterium sp. cf046]
MQQTDRAAVILSATFLSGRALAASGLSRHRVKLLLAEGELLRLRNGRYVRGDVCEGLIRAGRLGGRLDCVSLLAALGIFVRVEHSLHAQFDRGTTRLPPRPPEVVAHWRPSGSPRSALASDIVGALAQACRCQAPRDAIASLDNAWHRGFVDEDDIAAIFARLPRRYRALRELLDRRSESGPETIMRLMLRGLGCDVQVQVAITGVGRVDLIVDGWLIVECDSREFHGGWEAQKRDRARDIAAATLGYTTIRPIAEDILYRTESVLATMKQVLDNPARLVQSQNSTAPRRRERRRTA